MKKKYVLAVLLATVCLAVGCGKKADEDQTDKKPDVALTETPTATPTQNKDSGDGSADQDGPGSTDPGQENPGDTDQPSADPGAAETPGAAQEPDLDPTQEPSGPTQAPAEPTPGDLMVEAEACIGESLDVLMEKCGGPNSSTYEEDPESGNEIGYHYYDGFTVSTAKSEDGGETVTGVW